MHILLLIQSLGKVSLIVSISKAPIDGFLKQRWATDQSQNATCKTFRNTGIRSSETSITWNGVTTQTPHPTVVDRTIRLAATFPRRDIWIATTTSVGAGIARVWIALPRTTPTRQIFVPLQRRQRKVGVGKPTHRRRTKAQGNGSRWRQQIARRQKAARIWRLQGHIV